MQGQPQFLEIVEIRGHDGPVFGLAQDWQQQGRENADDGDDHEEFDKGESSALPVKPQL